MEKQKNKHRLWLCIALILSSATGSYAQSVVEERYDAFSKLLSPEKLYLQTDKEVYCVGDTVWFKGYLVNNSALSEFPESNYIYVELITYAYEQNSFSGRIEENPHLAQRVKIKRRDGILQGYVVIGGETNTGYAVLRGYTYWNLNQQPEYIFSKNIEIVNPMKDSFIKELQDKDIHENYQYTQLGVRNPFHKEKQRKRDLDCAFLPESGHLAQGIRSVVGFKAINEEGYGEEVSGVLYNSKDEEITPFSSNSLGMGKFSFTPIAGETYYAVVNDTRGESKKISLPTPESNAVVLNMNYSGENIVAETYCSTVYNENSLRFVLCNGTEIFFDEPVSKVKKIALPLAEILPGINIATITDVSGNIYAKRAFFVMPNSADTLSLIANKPRFDSREHATFTVTLPEEMSGDFSISITDDSLSPSKGKTNNILSYMLLASEIKGEIENPQSYFDPAIPEQERAENIDLLLMTQGWEYYDLPTIFKGEYSMPQFGKEYIQTVSGQVKRFAHSNKPVIVSFLAPSIGFSAMGQLDSAGYFELRDVNFPDSTQFIVNSVGLNGRRSFIPQINEDSFAPMLEYRRASDTISYSKEFADLLIQNYYNTGGDQIYQLDPIYITGQRLIKPSYNISPLANQMFKPGQLREEKELEPFRGYDLMTYVVETCQGLRYGSDTTTGERKLLCKTAMVSSGMQIESDGWEEIIVYIDGFPAASSSELANYTMDEIAAVAYLRGNDAAPYSPMVAGSPTIRSVVLVKTKPSTRRTWQRNIALGYPLGWQKPKDFYSPKYTVDEKKSATASDLRSTIYWNPALKIEGGSGEFDFYTSDSKSDYTIIIEGITDSGEYLFHKSKIKISR